MALALVASEKSVPYMVARWKNVLLTVVVRLPPIQKTKKRIGVMLLAPLSDVCHGATQEPADGMLISHSSKNH